MFSKAIFIRSIKLLFNSLNIITQNNNFLTCNDVTYIVPLTFDIIYFIHLLSLTLHPLLASPPWIFVIIWIYIHAHTVVRPLVVTSLWGSRARIVSAFNYLVDTISFLSKNVKFSFDHHNKIYHQNNSVSGKAWL